MIGLLVAFFLVQSARSVGPNSGLQGLHFKISASHVRPSLMITMDSNGNYSYSGITKEIVDWMFNSKANASYEFVVIDQRKAGSMGLPLYTTKMLLEGKIDIISLGIVPTPERKNLMDFTHPVVISPYQFVVPFPQAESRLVGPIKPFQKEVWIAFFLTTAAFVVFLSLETHRRDRNKNDLYRVKSYAEHLSDSILYIITVIIGNGSYMPWHFFRVRILLIVWRSMCVILVNSYTGKLTSSLAFPRVKSIPSSFEELADRKDLQLVLQDKMQLTEDILSAKQGAFKILGDSMRQHPELIFQTQADFAHIFLTMGDKAYAYPDINIFTYLAVSALNRYRSAKCDLSLSKPLSKFQIYSWGLTRHGQHNKAVTNKLQYIWENGLVDFWLRKYRPNIDKCLKFDKLPSRNAPLKLIDLSSAFFLLGVGLFSSIVIAIGEILYFEKKAFTAEFVAYVYWVVGLVSLLFHLLGRIVLAMTHKFLFYFWRVVRIMQRG